MNEREQRAAIKFLWKEGCPAKEIHDRLQAVYGDAAYAHARVYYWVKELRCGRDDTLRQTRPGRPPIENLEADIMCGSSVVHWQQFVRSRKRWAFHMRQSTDE
jgi:hypothetical protein